MSPEAPPESLVAQATSNGILHMGRFFTLLTEQSLQDALQIAEKAIRHISDHVDLPLGEISVPLVIRCVTRKAFEMMFAILILRKHHHSYAATALLRSLCEELLYIKFLRTLSLPTVDIYLGEMLHLETLQAASAQKAFLSPFSSVTSSELTTISEHEKRLKALGAQLGWGRRISPSVKYMAQQTQSEQIYDFFYHATSKSVHAGVSQLARMAWGIPNSTPNHGTFSITTSNFDGYYHRVNIVYGAWLFSKIIDVATEEFPDMWDDGMYEQYLTKITKVTKDVPPMLTEEELRWPPK